MATRAVQKALTTPAETGKRHIVLGIGTHRGATSWRNGLRVSKRKGFGVCEGGLGRFR